MLAGRIDHVIRYQPNLPLIGMLARNSITESRAICKRLVAHQWVTVPEA